MAGITDLGVGIGWRSEIDLTVERLPGVDFVEVVAENLHIGHLPESVTLLLERGIPVLPHAVSLSLGGAVATHVQREDPWLLLPVVMGALVWLSLLLRDPRLRALLPLRSGAARHG